MASLIPSLETIDRTVAIEIEYTLSRLRVLERLPGNPVGVTYRRAGATGHALMARHLPVPSFNTAYGLKTAITGTLRRSSPGIGHLAGALVSSWCPAAARTRSPVRSLGWATSNRASMSR